MKSVYEQLIRTWYTQKCDRRLNAFKIIFWSRRGSLKCAVVWSSLIRFGHILFIFLSFFFFLLIDKHSRLFIFSCVMIYGLLFTLILVFQVKWGHLLIKTKQSYMCCCLKLEFIDKICAIVLSFFLSFLFWFWVIQSRLFIFSCVIIYCLSLLLFLVFLAIWVLKLMVFISTTCIPSVFAPFSFISVISNEYAVAKVLLIYGGLHSMQSLIRTDIFDKEKRHCCQQDPTHRKSLSFWAPP